MGRAQLKKGVEVLRSGRTFQLKLQIDDGWQVEDTRTGRVDFIRLERLLQEYLSGALQFPQDDRVVRKVKGINDRFVTAMLDTLPEQVRNEILVRRKFLEDYLKSFGDKHFSLTTIEEGLRLFWNAQDHGPAPHPSSIKRWLKAYLESGRNLLVLSPASHRKGNRKRRVSVEVEEFCQQAIQEIFLTKTRGNRNDAYERALSLIAQENRTRPKEHQLSYPRPSYIRSLIDRIPEIERYTARYGKQAAMHRFRTSIGHASSEHPLARVEVDHTYMDVVIVDEEGQEIGRPWITLCIEHFTKCIVGFHVSFDPPSHSTVAKALKMCLMPKLWLREQYPEVKGEWPMFGIMEELVTDNGLEFHGVSLESACYSLGINISYCPRKTPWWKGTVERVLGTLNRGVAARMPGRTFSSIKEKGDQNPLKEAGVTLPTLRACIVKWIVDYYHQKTHSTLGMSPYEKWQRHVSLDGISIPANPEELDAVIGRVETRRLWHYGIELHSLLYSSDELSLLRQRFGDPCVVDIRWDSEDLGAISIVLPEGGFLTVPVIPSMAAYATGLSLYQHKVNKRYAAVKQKDTQDVVALAEVQDEILESIKADMAMSKKKTRIRQNRLRSQSATLPEAIEVAPVNAEKAMVMPLSKTSSARPVFQAIPKHSVPTDLIGETHE